jgi:hypothetical protein
LANGLIRVETSRKYEAPVATLPEKSATYAPNATANTLDITEHLTHYWSLRVAVDNVVQKRRERREGVGVCGTELGTDGVRRS